MYNPEISEHSEMLHRLQQRHLVIVNTRLAGFEPSEASMPAEGLGVRSTSQRVWLSGGYGMNEGGSSLFCVLWVWKTMYNSRVKITLPKSFIKRYEVVSKGHLGKRKKTFL